MLQYPLQIPTKSYIYERELAMRHFSFKCPYYKPHTRTHTNTFLLLSSYYSYYGFHMAAVYVIDACTSIGYKPKSIHIVIL